MSKANLTTARARELLEYDPELGTFSWIDKRKSKRSKTVGHKSIFGYLQIRIDGYLYMAHRVAMIYMGHEDLKSSDQVDHINGDTLDNRYSNLRIGDRSLNQQNLRRAKRHNKSGVLGVTFHPKRNNYTANIVVNGVRKYLGVFMTKEAAGIAYLEQKRILHPGCTI